MIFGHRQEFAGASAHYIVGKVTMAKEKIVFFKKKWLHEHISTIVLCVVAWIGIIIWTALKLRGSDSYALLGAIGSMLAILFYVVLYNRMMVYVENHAYRATPDKETETKN